MNKATHYGDMAILSSGQAVVSFSNKKDTATVTRVSVHTEDKTGEIASWGSNNDYPQILLSKARLNGVAMSGLRVLRKNHYGGGFVLSEETFTPAEEGKPSKRVITQKSLSEFSEIQEFWKINQMDRFHKETIADLETWALGCPEYILSNDFKKVTRVKRQQTANARFELMNEKTGYIKNLWISHKWQDGVDLKSNYAKSIPLIDSYWSPEEVKEYCKANKIHNFVRPVFYPLLNEGYYPKADWHAVIDNGWVDVSNSIPAFKKALFENQLNIKYHIEISEEFFERKYKNDWRETFDENKRKEIQTKFVDELDASLRDNKNAGTSIMSIIYTDDNGNPLPGLKITAIDNKIKDGAYLPEASAANSEILSAQGVDVGLIGQGIPGGKTLNGSGSDKRIAWEIQSSMMKSNRETSLEPFEFIRDYNGWPSNLKGAFENTSITTLDVNPTGTQKNSKPMIVKDITTVENHIAVNNSFEYKNIKPYLKRAERSFLKPLLGTAQIAIFDTGSADEIVTEAIKLAEEALSNYAYYLYLPIGEVQVTSGGIVVQSNTNSQPATPAQTKSLQRSFKTAAHETLDELLEFMEANAAKFGAWTSSVNYTKRKDTLVQTTAEFNRYFNINNSRQAFVSLLPTLRLVEDQYIKTPIQTALLTALKTTQTVANRKEVKELLQKSIVASTIAKTVENGVFVIASESMHLRFDMLPYENKVAVMSEHLTNTRKNKEVEAQQYLSEAIKIIKDNPSDFSEYTISNPSVSVSKLHTTPGITSVF